MNTEQAINRIKKLLAMAGDASNPYEAAMAAGRAQEMMSKHRIDAAQVQGEADKPIEAVEMDVLFATTGKQRPRWKGRLAMALGEANGIHIYWAWTTDQGQYVRCIKAVGQPSVVQVTAFTFQFIVAEIDRLAKRKGGCGRTWLNNFRLGAVKEVSDRVTEQAAKDIPPESEGEEGLIPSGALATIAKEVDRQVKTLGLRCTGGSEANWDGGAFAAGQRAGQNIEVRNGARGAITS